MTNPKRTWSVASASPSDLAYASGALFMCALRGERLWRIVLNNADNNEGEPDGSDRFYRVNLGYRSTVELRGAGHTRPAPPEWVYSMEAIDCSVWTSHLFAHLPVDILRG